MTDRPRSAGPSALGSLQVLARRTVRMMAGTGELVVLPGEGHLLGRSDDVIAERLATWLPDVLGLD